MKKNLVVGSLTVLWAVMAWSQGADIRAILGYPQTVLHNAKIITVSDASFTSNLGAIAQAMAIRDGKILATGTNAEMLALAGPQTERIDLKGRTVVPGFITVHNHPQDWAHVVPQIVKKAVPEDVMVARFLTGPPQKQMEEFPRVLEEAVLAAKPGVWIYVVLIWGPETLPRDPYLNWAGSRITKQMLDMMAPNNPVLVRSRPVINGGGINGVLNAKAVEAIRKDGLPETLADLRNLQQEEKTGVMSALGVYRMGIPEVIFKHNLEAYTEMLRLDMSWWTAIGQTTVAQFLYHFPQVLKAHRILDQRGQLSNRVAWGWGELPQKAWERDFQDPFLVADLATREGEGTDYLWYYGTGQIGGCITMEPLPTSRLAGKTQGLPSRVEAQVQDQPKQSCEEVSVYRRGGAVWNALFQIVKSGGRLIGSHEIGDGDVDLIMDLIEEASKEAGLTPEEIRARRHTADHMYAWPRPDQIPRLKKLGMITGGTNRTITWSSPQLFEDYGEGMVERIVPRGALVNAGVMNGIELDKPYELTDLNVFSPLYWSITRKADVDGKTYAPNQKISREQALKTGTIWGAYYVLKEEVLGSLERGKFADLLVLDRDYLTIPEEDIPNIRILMTMVGGRVEHLVPSLAGELGMQPAGAAVELGGAAASY